MSKTFDLNTTAAYNRLLDMSAGIIDNKQFYEAAKDFVDAYEHCESTAETSADERKLPEPLEVYRDVFGQKYLVLSVAPEGVFGEAPTIVLNAVKRGEIFTLPLDEFLNPEFIKIT